ncbi:unnamed protein product [Adineta steineri]|uniref:Uncharacterized protein n=1 Tax=Adineta steineri TaxID=433720 RepID=A0A814L756_9BILA|nr:unnamed protein product [Adineta steineri]CAF3668942.1 unnamed protein product [Adineta steineri]CAF3762802.1 unnamed protein product [Adineta steineri]
MSVFVNSRRVVYRDPFDDFHVTYIKKSPRRIYSIVDKPARIVTVKSNPSVRYRVKTSNLFHSSPFNFII